MIYGWESFIPIRHLSRGHLRLVCPVLAQFSIVWCIILVARCGNLSGQVMSLYIMHQNPNELAFPWHGNYGRVVATKGSRPPLFLFSCTERFCQLPLALHIGIAVSYHSYNQPPFRREHHGPEYTTDYTRRRQYKLLQHRQQCQQQHHSLLLRRRCKDHALALSPRAG